MTPRFLRQVGREACEALFVAVILALFARTFVVQAFQIPTPSMEPALLVGDHLLVNKMIFRVGGGPLLPGRAVRRGDVVVFRAPIDPRRDFVKRCVGLPGDRVEIVNKVLRVNGVAVDESAYALHTDPRTYPHAPLLPDALRQRDNFGPVLVPADSYFCLGDNRDNSDDSRFWGVVPASAVKGRAVAIYWSTGGAGEGAGALDRLLAAAGFTRWRRCLRPVR